MTGAPNMEADVLHLPGDPTLIVLAGVSGVGKSTFAHRLFPETAVVSSDRCRALISDSENDQSVTGPAFALVNFIAEQRLRNGRTTVIDSTALKARDRRKLVALASANNVPAMLIMLAGDRDLWLAGQDARRQVGGRVVPVDVLDRMAGPYRETIARVHDGRVISEEGFAAAVILDRAQADAITRVQPPAAGDLSRSDVDVIGDVHGCADELRQLLSALGYEPDSNGVPVHPDGRLAVFVGDLADRGPDSLGVLRLVAAMTDAGSGMLGSVGNHDWKNWRLFVAGRDVTVSHGLDATVEQVARADAEREYRNLCDRLYRTGPASTVFDGGRLVVVHGAVLPHAAGRAADRARKSRDAALALYGETAGTREDGLPIRTYRWADAWKDTDTTVVFGHDVIGDEPRWINKQVVGIDTGCVFGGRLTALRWPSKEIAQVPAGSAAAVS